MNAKAQNRGLIAYGTALTVAGLTLASALVLQGYTLGSLPAVAVLALVAAIAERSSVRLSNTLEVSICTIPILFAAVLFGPLAAMVVAAASMIMDLRPAGDQPYLRWAIQTASRTVTAAATGIVVLAAKDIAPSELAGLALASTAGALVSELLDVSSAAAIRRLRRRARLNDLARTLAPLVMASVPLYAPVVALLAISYQSVSPWTLPLFLVPALAAQRLFSLYQDQRRLTQDVMSAYERLERANISFATALVTTLDARDRYTAGHSAAVAIYARDIAARMHLTEEQQKLAHLCGLVHDIGKIGLPPGLLEKPGGLTLEERRQMEEHSAIGERILAKVEDYAEVALIVRHHHERIDGHGYPDELVDEAIPLISRIIAVADAYNAMTSDRPYREAMPSRVARLRLAQAVDSQFDTTVVAAFEALLASATEAYKSGQRDDFSLIAQDQYSNLREVVNH